MIYNYYNFWHITFRKKISLYYVGEGPVPTALINCVLCLVGLFLTLLAGLFVRIYVYIFISYLDVFELVGRHRKCKDISGRKAIINKSKCSLFGQFARKFGIGKEVIRL